MLINHYYFVCVWETNSGTMVVTYHTRPQSDLRIRLHYEASPPNFCFIIFIYSKHIYIKQDCDLELKEVEMKPWN